MTGTLLTVNAGSATLKLSGWSTGKPPFCRWRVAIDLQDTGAGGKAPRWQVAAGEFAPTLAPPGSRASAHLRAVVECLAGRASLCAIAHRVVHGGARTDVARPIDAGLLRELHALSPLAPLHQPVALALIEDVAGALPGVTQLACFDTAFHATQPELAQRYALPEALWQAGVKSYGFHGLSYASVHRQLIASDPGMADARLIVAHLGNGASACAMDSGRSVATTMGFSALDGLVMGTRCGRIDPGVLLYLQRSMGYDVAALEDLLYRRSGLLGVSGISSDVRDLLANGTPAALLALELFSYRAAREIASLVPTLSGVDALVFTGGIGEHQPGIRANIVRYLHGIGAAISESANDEGRMELGSREALLRVLLCQSDEEETMAHESSELLMYVNR